MAYGSVLEKFVLGDSASLEIVNLKELLHNSRLVVQIADSEVNFIEWRATATHI